MIIEALTLIHDILADLQHRPPFFPAYAENRMIELRQIIDDLHTCPHKKTVCINEEGNAGVFCVDCHRRVEETH